MSGEGDDDIGFTQAQQDWIRQLITSQQKDETYQENPNQNEQIPPVTSQLQSAGNLGERRFQLYSVCVPIRGSASHKLPSPYRWTHLCIRSIVLVLTTNKFCYGVWLAAAGLQTKLHKHLTYNTALHGAQKISPGIHSTKPRLTCNTSQVLIKIS